MQQQPQVVVIPQGYNVSFPAPAIVVADEGPFLQRLKTTYGIVRAALFLVGMIQFGVVFGAVPYMTPVYLVCLPLAVIVPVHSFMAFFFQQCRVKPNNATMQMMDFIIGGLFVLQTLAWYLIYYLYGALYERYGDYISSAFAKCAVCNDLLATGTATAILISICYILLGINTYCGSSQFFAPPANNPPPQVIQVPKPADSTYTTVPQ